MKMISWHKLGKVILEIQPKSANVPSYPLKHILCNHNNAKFYSSQFLANQNVYQDCNCIYKGPFIKQIKLVKIFALASSLMGLAAQPLLFEQGIQMGGLEMATLICSTTGLLMIVKPLILHKLCKKYVAEIEYNSATQEYKASTLSFLLLKKYIKFHLDDIKSAKNEGNFTSFTVGKNSLLVDPNLFQDFNDYIRMMGDNLDVSKKTIQSESISN